MSVRAAFPALYNLSDLRFVLNMRRAVSDRFLGSRASENPEKSTPANRHRPWHPSCYRLRTRPPKNPDWHRPHSRWNRPAGAELIISKAV